MPKVDVKLLVAFAILMENGEGIVGKAPDYILEKYETAILSSEDYFLQGTLDAMNKAKYNRWLARWG